MALWNRSNIIAETSNKVEQALEPENERSMLPFFGKKNRVKSESDDSRLRVVEWKVNLILILVGIQLALTALMLVRQFLIPSTTTLILCGLALAVVIWVFRNQIPGLVKRLLVRQIVGDDSAMDSPTQTEDSIK